MKRVVLSALLLGAPLTHAYADGSAAVSPALGLLQTLLGLAVVIGLIFATSWLMRRVAPQGMNRGPIRVVASAAVGPRERVVVVRFEGDLLTLGVAPGHVVLLQSKSLPEDTPVAGDPVGEPAFAARLKKLLVRSPAP
jgi:flagellar protein FliO/FliZ